MTTDHAPLAADAAEALATKLLATYADRLAKLAPAAAAARPAIRQAATLARICYEIWNDAAMVRRELELLALGFGVDAARSLVRLPEVPNVAAEIFDVAGATLIRVPTLAAGRPANATAQQVLVHEQAAARLYASTHASELSAELLALFRTAGLAPDGTDGRSAR